MKYNLFEFSKREKNYFSTVYKHLEKYGIVHIFISTINYDSFLPQVRFKICTARIDHLFAMNFRCIFDSSFIQFHNRKILSIQKLHKI